MLLEISKIWFNNLMTDLRASSFLIYAKRFFYGTALSRILGMVRDMTLAMTFGASAEIAVFMLSYRFIYIFRRLFGESTLQASFIPYFEQYRLESQEKGLAFFRDFFWSLTLFLFVLGIFLEVPLSFFTHPIVSHIQIMLPAVVFIVLFALSSSFLFCEKSYLRPSIAPAIFNLVWIGSLWILPSENKTYWVAFALVFAFFIQWAVVGWSSFKKIFENTSPSFFFRPVLFSKQVKTLLKPMGLILLGIGATQLNSIIDGFYAYYADPAGPAFLWYAIRWQQLPISLIAVSISGAILPSLSRAIQKKDSEMTVQIFENALKTACLLMIVAFFAIFTLGGPGLNFVYGRGAFSSDNTVYTLKCLWAYLAGLLPMTFLILLAARSQAEKNYRLPMISSMGAVICNIFLNTLFVFAFSMKVESVALATSISALIQCFFYKSFLVDVLSVNWVRPILKTLIAAFISMVTSLWIGKVYFQDPTIEILNTGTGIFIRGTLNQVICLATMTFTYLALFTVLATTLKIKELRSVLKDQKSLVSVS